MNISAKINYACKALLELSLHWPKEDPMQISAIAHKQKIPLKFLVHILIQLKQLGYVKSMRGKMGGYVLAKPPDQIRFGDVIKGFGGLGYSTAHKKKSTQVIESIWEEINDAVNKAMEQINFETICNRERNNDNAVMYEI